MKKYLIVIDMQKDFVDGALGSKEAETIVPAVLNKVNAFDGEVIFTKDTHFEDYMATSEGKMLPVEHCIKGTEGWQLIAPLEKYCTENNCKVYEKLTFGSVELSQDMRAVWTAGLKERGADNAECASMAENSTATNIESIELIGLCTDICVVSNALLLKAFLPEVPISVDAACCAGVTPEKHAAALETMRSCQILVK